jgi:N-acetylglutamate synthase-like GNAT family acetyltransferase
VAGVVGTAFYLKELSVDPDHGQRGIGTALLENYLDHARWLGFGVAALSTFRAIPFNAPFYARHGFAIVPLDAAPDELRAQFLAEVPAGIDAQSRVLMVRSLRHGIAASR